VADPPSDHSQLRPDNLDHLRKLAKQLLRRARNDEEDALARFASITGTADPGSLTLSQAQHVIAREAGFPSWPKARDEANWRQDVRSKHRLGSATSVPIRETQMTNESLQLAGIDQIGLSCTDLDEAEHFYCGVLGLQLAGAVPNVMKFFGCNGLNIVMFRSDTISPNSIIYFRVPPEPGLINQKVLSLRSKAIRIESDPHVIARNWNGCDVWVAFFRDPFGNLLALKSDVPTR
jgi:catechol 2,3-dioxygenase-like lactoylglutathione lyase family enzyme